jgi:hypothetical protein
VYPIRAGNTSTSAGITRSYKADCGGANKQKKRADPAHLTKHRPALMSASAIERGGSPAPSESSDQATSALKARVQESSDQQKPGPQSLPTQADVRDSIGPKEREPSERLAALFISDQAASFFWLLRR